jgi:hypothetical protein
LNRHLVDAKLLGSGLVAILLDSIFLDGCRRFCTFTHNGHGTVPTA